MMIIIIIIIIIIINSYNNNNYDNSKDSITCYNSHGNGEITNIHQFWSMFCVMLGGPSHHCFWWAL